MEGRTEEEVKLATGWAGLMGRVADADMALGEEELEKIRDSLARVHRLSSRAAEAVTILLREHRAELLSIEDHLYARMINDVATREQKTALLRALFDVAAADDLIRESEDSTVRNISRSLMLSHKEFIEARLEHRDSLAVLKKDPS